MPTHGTLYSMTTDSDPEPVKTDPKVDIMYHFIRRYMYTFIDEHPEHRQHLLNIMKDVDTIFANREEFAKTFFAVDVLAVDASAIVPEASLFEAIRTAQALKLYSYSNLFFARFLVSMLDYKKQVGSWLPGLKVTIFCDDITYSGATHYALLQIAIGKDSIRIPLPVLNADFICRLLVLSADKESGIEINHDVRTHRNIEFGINSNMGSKDKLDELLLYAPISQEELDRYNYFIFTDEVFEEIKTLLERR